MASTLRMPAVLRGTDGYPVLSADDPAPYGVLNPRPTAAQIQRQGVGGLPEHGPLFGEYNDAQADSSLHQPNIAPDVVTVAVLVPPVYFGGKSTLLIKGGEPILLVGHKNRNASSCGKFNRRKDHVGCLHTCVINTSVENSTVKGHFEKEKNVAPGIFGTFTVGPVTVTSGKVAHIAVCVQNVTHVVTDCIDTGATTTIKPATRMCLVGRDDETLRVVRKTDVAEGDLVLRLMTATLPFTEAMHGQGTTTMDVHHVFHHGTEGEGGEEGEY